MKIKRKKRGKGISGYLSLFSKFNIFCKVQFLIDTQIITSVMGRKIVDK
jgi:hypothetical protein